MLLGCWREAFELFFCMAARRISAAEGSPSRRLRSRADALGQVPRVPLLFEPVVDDHFACGLAMLETVGGLVEGGLMEGDLLVEPGNHGGNVGFPLMLGADLTLRRDPGFFSGGMAVLPSAGVIGGPLGLLACLAGLGQIPYCPTRLAVLPDTAAGFQVGPGLPDLGESGFCLAQGGSPIWQADAGDGIAHDGRFGVEEGGQAGLLFGRERLEALW